MGHDHSATAISSAAQLIHGITRLNLISTVRGRESKVVELKLTRPEYPRQVVANSVPIDLQPPVPETYQ